MGIREGRVSGVLKRTVKNALECVVRGNKNSSPETGETHTHTARDTPIGKLIVRKGKDTWGVTCWCSCTEMKVKFSDNLWHSACCWVRQGWAVGLYSSMFPGFWPVREARFGMPSWQFPGALSSLPSGLSPPIGLVCVKNITSLVPPQKIAVFLWDKEWKYKNRILSSSLSYSTYVFRDRWYPESCRWLGVWLWAFCMWLFSALVCSVTFVCQFLQHMS